LIKEFLRLAERTTFFYDLTAHSGLLFATHAQMRSIDWEGSSHKHSPSKCSAGMANSMVMVACKLVAGRYNRSGIPMLDCVAQIRLD
jgi:hypothetical protein